MISGEWQGAARKAAETLFDSVCRVIVRRKEKAADGSAVFSEEVLFDGVPCRISYKTIVSAKRSSRTERLVFTRRNDTLASEISAEVKLFVPPEAEIPPGSEIEVTKAGKTMRFCSSGVAAVYSSHREIVVIPHEEFA